jgi:uncharacterized protein YjiS (DUF1127 family)
MIAVLSSLDDRILLDIGLHRGNIQRFVDGLDEEELMDESASARVPYDVSYADLRRAP